MSCGPLEVTQPYIEGIKEGRASFRKHGLAIAKEELANLNSTIKGFPFNSPVGQMLRGERDFWINQMKQGDAA